MFYVRFKKAFGCVLAAWLISVVVQGVARLYLLMSHATPEIFAGHQPDIVRMLWTGTRYDMRIACYAFALLFVTALLFMFSDTTFNLFKRIYPPLATLITIAIIFLTVVNIFYFKTFDKHIDVFIFSLIDDDTKAILITIWEDYPVILILLGTIAGTFLLYKFYKLLMGVCIRLVRKERPYPVAIIIILMIITLFAAGTRGSVGKFPLRRDNAQVSEIKLLNSLTPCAGMALDWAYKDYKRSNVFFEATDEEGRQIMARFFGKPVEPSLSVFYEKTEPFDIDRKPHVIIAIMESMGTHLLSCDSAENDILGALRKHWKEDLVFTRFVSGGNGTIDSLSRLLVRSYNENISMSTAQNVDFESNMLKPYINNGYKVVFVTSGSGSWRNLNGFLPNLGVDEFVEQNTLIKLYPDAKLSPWGIPDGYMFNYIAERLEQAEAEGEALLVIALSTTFHPPYKVPADYDPPVFTFTDEQKDRLANLSSLGSVTNIFNTLRYTNDRLGEFIDTVKKSKAGGHTVIAVTGDHNIRGIGYPDPKEVVLGHAVPLYLYVPEKFRRDATFDPLTPAGHKDIWPTLYNLTLPDTQYYNTGCDLLAPVKSDIWCFGYNKELAFDENGVYHNGSFMSWINEILTDKPSPITENDTFIRYQAYSDLIRWQFNRQIHRNK